MEAALVEHFATRGYAVASVEYRLTQVAPFPAQLSDVMCAVQFLRAHADQYGLDPARFAAAGHSAGGHLVAMLGLIRGVDWCELGMPHHEEPSDVQAVIGLSGAYHLDRAVQKVKLGEALGALLPGRKATLVDRAREASPATHVRPDAPPFLFMHGTEDPVCPIDSARAMARALRAVGARDVTLQEFHGYEHLLKFERIAESMDGFLDRVFLRD
jgi:acetyl esterase/lipase